MKYEVLEEPKAPRVMATPLAMKKMECYIHNMDAEIGWLGYVRKEEDSYIIDDVFLVKQKVHSATTELDTEALATLATELVSQGAEGIAKYNSIRVWGHSHVNMSTSPSGQDDNQMYDFADADYFVRLIGNKKGEWNVSLWDFKNNILWTELSLEYYFEVDINEDAIKKEIETLVSRIQPTTAFGKGLYNKPNKDTKLSSYIEDEWYYDEDYYGYGLGRYGYGYDYPRPSKYYGQTEKETKETQEKEAEALSDLSIQNKYLTAREIDNVISYYLNDLESMLVLMEGSAKEIQDMLTIDLGAPDLYEYYITALQKKAIEVYNTIYGGKK